MKRSTNILVRVTEDEKQRLKQIAAENGLSVAEFVRLRCLYQANGTEAQPSEVISPEPAKTDDSHTNLFSSIPYKS